MSSNYMVDKSFTGNNFQNNKLAPGAYENCTFTNCTFIQSDLSKHHFQECIFVDCDLSMAKISSTAFRDVKFIGCKLLGLHFDECNTFLLEMSFDNCQLNLASFYKLSLKKTVFRNCILHEVEFAEADLSQSQFLSCDLSGAIFDNTNLEKSDFRTSINYSINPKGNKIKKAQFSIPDVIGLLDAFDIKIS